MVTDSTRFDCLHLEGQSKDCAVVNVAPDPTPFFLLADFSLSTAAAAAACHVINLLAKKWEGLERKRRGRERRRSRSPQLDIRLGKGGGGRGQKEEMQPEAERERNDQQKNKGRGKEVCFPSSFLVFVGEMGMWRLFYRLGRKREGGKLIIQMRR